MRKGSEAGPVPADPRRARLVAIIAETSSVSAYTKAYWNCGRDPVLAQDALQRAVVNVLTGDLPKEIADEEAYALGVVINAARMELRTETRHSGRKVSMESVVPSRVPSYPSPEGHVISQLETRATLAVAMEVAPTVVAFAMGYRHKEIAENQGGRTVPAVKKDIFNQRQELRKRLGR